MRGTTTAAAAVTSLAFLMIAYNKAVRKNWSTLWMRVTGTTVVCVIAGDVIR